VAWTLLGCIFVAVIDMTVGESNGSDKDRAEEEAACPLSIVGLSVGDGLRKC